MTRLKIEFIVQRQAMDEDPMISAVGIEPPDREFAMRDMSRRNVVMTDLDATVAMSVSDKSNAGERSR